MIESNIPDDYVLRLPLEEAVELLATMAWLIRLGSDPSFKLRDAKRLTLGECLAAETIAEG